MSCQVLGPRSCRSCPRRCGSDDVRRPEPDGGDSSELWRCPQHSIVETEGSVPIRVRSVPQTSCSGHQNWSEVLLTYSSPRKADKNFLDDSPGGHETTALDARGHRDGLLFDGLEGGSFQGVHIKLSIFRGSMERRSREPQSGRRLAGLYGDDSLPRVCFEFCFRHAASPVRRW